MESFLLAIEELRFRGDRAGTGQYSVARLHAETGWYLNVRVGKTPRITPQQVLRIARRYRDVGVSEINVADTAGLADPAPVAQTFFVDQDVQDATRLDAVVTVVDAKWLKDRLKDAPEAKNQVAFADVIILNKIDLVTPEELKDVEAQIRAINPYAKLHRTERSAVSIADVMDRNAFDLDRILDIEPDFLEEGHHHHHDDDMQSVSFRFPGDVDPDKFMPWVQDLTQREGPNILRCKGILAFKNEPKRFVFQGVHMILDGDLQRDWKADETRESKIVFIGRKLDRKAIEQGFMATAA